MINSENRKQLRATLERFSPITDESFETLCDLCRERQVVKEEYLLRLGQIPKSMLFVTRGILISEYAPGDGNIHIKNFFLEGNFAASTSAVLQEAPSRFAIRCIEDGLILEMNYFKYKALVMSRPDLMKFYINYIEAKWIIENEKRQMALATASATDQYLSFKKQYPGLEERVSQQRIALFLGITPTQLSRIRKDLKKS